MKKKLDEMENRMRALEKENKDTQFNNAQLANDLIKARERETTLEKFMVAIMNSFTQMSSQQSNNILST